MKFKDIKVGETYRCEGLEDRKIVFKTDKYLIAEVCGYPSNYLVNDRHIETWTKAPEVITKTFYIFYDRLGNEFAFDNKKDIENVRKNRLLIGHACGEIQEVIYESKLTEGDNT